jgi:hypothetical protein
VGERKTDEGSDEKYSVYFVKFDDSLREAGDIAGSDLKIMLGQTRATQIRKVRRFDHVAREQTR